MKTIVSKFGGSCLASADIIGSYLLAGINLRERNVIVTSAMYGVTQLLQRLWESEKRDPLLRKLVAHHAIAIERLHLMPFSSGQRVVQEKLRRALETQSRAEVLAVGEDLSQMIVEMYLRAQRVRVRRWDARHLVKTSESAEYVPGATRDNIAAALGHEKTTCVDLISGFIASDISSNRTTTLSRGGSDLTASLVAEALEADEIRMHKFECEKDEDGLFKSERDGRTQVAFAGIRGVDPNFLWSRRLREMSFEEALEMGRFGRKVLHPLTAEPLSRCGTPLFVCNLRYPSLGTRLSKHAVASPSPCFCVSTPERVLALETVAPSTARRLRQASREDRCIVAIQHGVGSDHRMPHVALFLVREDEVQHTLKRLSRGGWMEVDTRVVLQ